MARAKATMARAKATPPAYEPEALYSVKLKRPVEVGSVRLLPRDRHTIKGRLLDGIPADAVREARPV